MIPPFSTRPLNAKKDGCFFEEGVPIPEEDRSCVRRLSAQSSRSVWNAVVGQRVPASVLAETGWLKELRESENAIKWVDAWNADDSKWAQATLRPLLPWPDTATVLFVWSPEWCVTTTFAIFLRHWIAFLFDDEGPLLLNPERSEVVVFWPSGVCQVGQRR